MKSNYVPQHPQQYDARFGDIVILASGRLEKQEFEHFRFVEGDCRNDCDSGKLVALWQVKKIRHRDANRKFRYELKFSVSPLSLNNGRAGGGGVKRKADIRSYAGKDSSLQTFIQKDDDYPRNFGTIIYPEESDFVDRRLDEQTNNARIVRPGAVNNNWQTPVGQSTFMHALFQPPPPPARPETLNMGEYVQAFVANKPAHVKAQPFPNILSNLVNGGFAPTTYRPFFQGAKFVRNEIYPSATPLPPAQQSFGIERSPSSPVITHHFHHHFYMPGTSNENFFENSEHQILHPVTPSIPSDVTIQSTYNDIDEQQSPSPQKFVFPTSTTEVGDEEIVEQHIVHVTPAPLAHPLRKPSLFGAYPAWNYGGRQQLIIYPSPLAVEQQSERPTARQKQAFVQSELMNTTIHYSEPDPLYLNSEEILDEDLSAHQSPQVEAPFTAYHSSNSKKPDSIADSLPPPAKNQDIRVPYVDEDVQPQDSKQRQTQTTSDDENSEANPEANFETTETHRSTTSITTSSSSLATTTALKNLLSSTSARTTTSRTSSRYKNPHVRSSTTTTEQPVLKWKPRRKHKYPTIDDNKAKGSKKREQRLKKNKNSTSTTTEHNNEDDRHLSTTIFLPTLSPNDVQMSIATTTDKSLKSEEAYEVLTQKSVSKTVSIKVGQNGEEFPIFTDDENELKQ